MDRDDPLMRLAAAVNAQALSAKALAGRFKALSAAGPSAAQLRSRLEAAGRAVTQPDQDSRSSPR